MTDSVRAGARVLPTLNADGTRRRIRPKLYDGRFVRARRGVGFALVALFVALPLVRVGGKQAMLLDVAHREFTFFGTTFFATDGVLLMLLLLSIFVGVIWVTALAGRVWCGWACPQTVYMEFVFRPLERLFEGAGDARRRAGAGTTARRVAKYAVFAGLSVLLGNLFLSYFVGVDALRQWVQQSPFDRPGQFLVMAATSALVFLDFAWFREQMCTVVCPYARLQSALLDDRSLLVGYDRARGEPRAKGKPGPGRGDCVDCGACVRACPTGIDIRDGLQLECIACAQCVDACDSVMDKIKKPRGLVRYSSQRGLRGEPSRILRPRTIIYTIILVGLVTALVVLLMNRSDSQVTLLRTVGTPFIVEAGEVINPLRLRVENRSPYEKTYDVSLRAAPPGSTLSLPQGGLRLASRSEATANAILRVRRAALVGPRTEVIVVVKDGAGFERELKLRVLGPRTNQETR